MGDRGNVRIKYDDGNSVYLYTHWGGTELSQMVARALDRGRKRWDDPSYLARIIFCEMVKGYEMEETGFGIAPYETVPDLNHPTITVDPGSKMVHVGEETCTFECYAYRALSPPS